MNVEHAAKIILGQMPNRNSDTETVAAWCRDTYLPAEIVGRWVWVRFTAKPSAEVRQELKAAGFRFVPRRESWAHSCGIRSRKAPYDPRDKYGSVSVDCAHSANSAQDHPSMLEGA